MPIPLAIPIALAAAGAGLSGAGALWGQNPARNEKFPTLDPEQIAAQNALLQEVLSGLKNPEAGPYGFGPIEQQARSQFGQRTIPSIAERFAAADAQRGSAFQQALGQAGAGLEENLAALKSQYNMNRLSQLANLAQLGLHSRFDWVHTPAGPNAFGKFAGTVGPALMNIGTFGALGGFGDKEDNKLSYLMSLLGTSGQSPLGGIGIPGPRSQYYKSHPAEYLKLYGMTPESFMQKAEAQTPLSNAWLDEMLNRIKNLQNPYQAGPEYMPGSPYMYNANQGSI